MSEELRGLYSGRLRLLWITKFVPVLLVLIIGIRILIDLLNKVNLIPLEMLWIFYAAIGVFGIGIFMTTVGLFVTFIKEYSETKSKLKNLERYS